MKEYNQPINIDINLWISILENEDITWERIKNVFLFLLECKDCESSFENIKTKIGKAPNKLVVCFSQRILNHFPNIKPIKNKNGKNKERPMYCNIPFIIKLDKNKKYWKLRPELKEALLKLSW